VTHEARRGEVLGAENLKRNERKKTEQATPTFGQEGRLACAVAGDTDSNAAHAARRTP